MKTQASDPSREITFAVGDVHGRLDALTATLAACRRYAAGRSATFVMLGDYIDRGPESAGVVALLRNWTGPERLVCLKGNHEDMLILTLQHPDAAGAVWHGNGGRATLRSYRVARPEEIPQDDVRWMAGLPLFHDDGLRFFCHAGIDRSRPLSAQRPEVLMYSKKVHADATDPGRFVVHGHTPVHGGMPLLAPHRLNLDTGAGFGGELSAAAFLPDRRDPVALIVGGRIMDLAAALGDVLGP